jgi:hypothetical protein
MSGLTCGRLVLRFTSRVKCVAGKFNDMAMTHFKLDHFETMQTDFQRVVHNFVLIGLSTTERSLKVLWTGLFRHNIKHWHCCEPASIW